MPHRNTQKTECPQGHPYDEENTAIVKGHRVCRTCRREKSLAWYHRNKDSIKKDNGKIRARRYGLTKKQVDRMIRKQKGRCKICRELPSGRGASGVLHVDHDSETGAVRGMLCSNCNRGIGMLRHDPKILRRAIKYLDR